MAVFEYQKFSLICRKGDCHISGLVSLTEIGNTNHQAALHIFDISIIIILLDIDECTSGNPCSSGEVCINLLGTYTCLIDASTQIQAGMYACNDINMYAWLHHVKMEKYT